MKKIVFLFYILIITLSLAAQMIDEKVYPFIGESASEKTVSPRDEKIGLDLDNEKIRSLLENFIKNGPAQDTVLEGSFEMLKLKYAHAAFNENDRDNHHIRFSLLAGDGPEYTILWRTMGTKKETSGRFYLIKTGEAYLIEDWEID